MREIKRGKKKRSDNHNPIKFAMRIIRELKTRGIRFLNKDFDAVVIDEYRYEACVKALQTDGYKKIGICSLRDGPVYVECLIATLLSRVIKKIKGRRQHGYYIYWFIKLSKASVAISYIDDSPSIYITASRLPKVKFLIFQNGIRPLYDLRRINSLLMENKVESLRNLHLGVHGLATFNDYRDQLGKYGLNLRLTGSLLNNATPISHKAKNKERKIGFISQYRANAGYIRCGDSIVSSKDFYKAEKELLSIAINFAMEHDYTLEVIGTNSWQKDVLDSEISFYSELVGHRLAFSTGTDSYNSLVAYEFVITIDSTLGLEAASRGSKVMFADIRLINHPEIHKERSLHRLFKYAGSPRIFDFIATNTKDLEDKLLNALNISNEDYTSIWEKDCKPNVLGYNPM